ncbi:MAG: hypothetical protein LBR26_10515 [Prevotella sp.]|jgi:hypothetical protein|nr:hypothetical protein [Prevotella sp.]
MKNGCVQKILQYMGIVLCLFGWKYRPKRLYLDPFFPDWHPKAGQPTNFRWRILTGRHTPKIHAIVFRDDDWARSQKLVNAGRQELHICYYLTGNISAANQLISKRNRMRVQKGSFLSSLDAGIRVEGKIVALNEFAANEGLGPEDFKAWYRGMEGQEFFIVHFTDFVYESYRSQLPNEKRTNRFHF